METGPRAGGDDVCKTGDETSCSLSPTEVVSPAETTSREQLDPLEEDGDLDLVLDQG